MAALNNCLVKFWKRNSLLKPLLAALAQHCACTRFLKPDASIHSVIYVKSPHIYQMTSFFVLCELFLFFPLKNIGITKVLSQLKFSHGFSSHSLWYYSCIPISIWLMVPSPTQLRHTTAIILESFSFSHIHNHILLTSHLKYVMPPLLFFISMTIAPI